LKIHEYQAKAILKRFGIGVPRGEACLTAREAAEIASRLGVSSYVLKAQVHAGGRGKGGGIRTAGSPSEVERLAGEMIGMKLVTHQTGPEGKKVHRLLVEEAQEIAREIYLGIVIDRIEGVPVIMACPEGGVEIEEVARRSPEKILKAPSTPGVGFSPFQARKLAYGVGLGPGEVEKTVALILSLARAFDESDASLIEVNPLVVTRDGDVVALDAKMSFDDNALYRHPDLRELRDQDEEEPLEIEASRSGLSYIKLQGDVGCMVNGAGLAMATMDLIQLAGGAPANFLDVGGGASADQVKNAFRILLSDKSVRAVLINIFGGIMRCDVVAEGVVVAAKQMAVRVPVVVRLEGTNVEEGRRILRDSGLNFTVASGMLDAARKVVSLSRGGP
jgi:succinyl-CoA synthetase beta subunit